LQILTIAVANLLISRVARMLLDSMLLGCKAT
jgi:hypothetical protein